jgi:hypothetical protein
MTCVYCDPKSKMMICSSIRKSFVERGIIASEKCSRQLGIAMFVGLDYK